MHTRPEREHIKTYKSVRPLPHNHKHTAPSSVYLKGRSLFVSVFVFACNVANIITDVLHLQGSARSMSSTCSSEKHTMPTYTTKPRSNRMSQKRLAGSDELCLKLKLKSNVSRVMTQMANRSRGH